MSPSIDAARRHLITIAGALAVLAALASPAAACGGLFCSRIPVDQAGEKILFIQDGDTVIAHVQIQYTGDAKDFSWIVPVPTQPTLGVGSDQLFADLRNATRPQFNLALTTEGDCAQPKNVPMLAPAAASAGATAGGVTVVSQNQVGPFDTAVLTADDPGALKTWLKNNNYVIPDKLDPLLDPYVAGKYYFAAYKLTKDASVGDIQPVVLKYKATKPGIPIRLTGIAATPNMALYVWILGEHRAIPENYRHAVINEARIDWLNNGQNYSQVVTAAMNEAGGQAFVTDYAGKSNAVSLSDLDASHFDLDAVRAASDPVAFANEVAKQGFFAGPTTGLFAGPVPAPGVATPIASNQRLIDFLKRYIQKPDAAAKVDDAAFYGNLAAYRTQLDSAQVTVDTAKAAQELDDSIVTPLKDINTQFGKHPYLTALFTTMSPEQMTQDPTFRDNPDLPDASNVHVAKGVVKCSSGVEYSQAPVQITLANGTQFLAERNTGGAATPVDLPASLRIEQMTTSGAPSTITDNRSKIAQVLAGAGGGAIAYDPTTGAAVTVARSGGFGCTGCAAHNNVAPPSLREGAGEGAAYALLVLGWMGYRRVKRRRR